MPTYFYIAKSLKGEEKSGTIEAKSKLQLAQTLKSQGFILISADLEKEEAAVKKAALDYVMGWFEGNAERMDKALHEELAKRFVLQDAKTGEDYFKNLTKQDMVKATENGGGKLIPADQRQIKIEILDIFKNIASARVESVSFIDFIHLAKLKEGWKVINVLFLPNAVERKAVQLDPKIYEDFVGLYEFPQGFKITITTQDGRMFAQVSGQPSVELFPESESKYFFEVVNAEAKFIRNTSRKVTEMMIYQGGVEAKGKKIE